MARAGAVTLADCQRQGRIMLEVGCTKCPRYSRHRLDKLIATHGPNCGLPSLVKSSPGTARSGRSRRATIAAARCLQWTSAMNQREQPTASDLQGAKADTVAFGNKAH